MCVFLISPVPIAEPLTSELIDTPVFYNLAPRPIKYRVSVPIPNKDSIFFMIEGQYHWYQYYWCLYKIVFPLNIQPLSVAIQHYSIIESNQF